MKKIARVSGIVTGVLVGTLGSSLDLLQPAVALANDGCAANKYTIPHISPATTDDTSFYLLLFFGLGMLARWLFLRRQVEPVAIVNASLQPTVAEVSCGVAASDFHVKRPWTRRPNRVNRPRVIQQWASASRPSSRPPNDYARWQPRLHNKRTREKRERVWSCLVADSRVARSPIQILTPRP